MSNTLLADGGLAPDQSSRAGNQHLSRKNLLFAGLGLAALMGAAWVRLPVLDHRPVRGKHG